MVEIVDKKRTKIASQAFEFWNRWIQQMSGWSIEKLVTSYRMCNNRMISDVHVTEEATSTIRQTCNKVKGADVDNYLGKALQDEYWNLKETYRADIRTDASGFFHSMNETF